MNNVKENNKEFAFKNIIQMYDLDFEDMTVGFHKKIPFTGFTFSMHPATGNLELLVSFKDGFQEGIYREWYENGQLKKVEEMTHGQSDGYEICWYPDGSLKSESQYMQGFIIYKKAWSEEGNITENTVFLENIDIYVTQHKNGMIHCQSKSDVYNGYVDDKFTYGIYKLFIENESDEKFNLYKQNYNQDYLQIKGQEVLQYIESNINIIYERETLYKHAVKKEMLEFNEGKAIYNNEAFTGLIYDMPFVEEVAAYVLFSICTYKNGYIHGDCVEWYSDGVIDPEKIVKEGCSDEGEYWYSKGSLKKYTRYKSGIKLDCKEWDESGNIKE